MPIYVYRAITESGLIVKNRVEEANKQILIKKLKNNNITPISVEQIAYKSKQTKNKKRQVIQRVHPLFVTLAEILTQKRQWKNHCRL